MTNKPNGNHSKRYWIISFLIIFFILGMLIPQLTKVKDGDAGHRMVCWSNLKNTHFALTSYAEKHNGQFPDDLFVLIQNGTMNFKQVKCIDQVSLDNEDRIPEKPYTQEKYDTYMKNSTYVYLGKGKRADMPDDQVLMYEKFGNHHNNKDYTNILFANGIVAFCRKDKILDILMKSDVDFKTHLDWESTLHYYP